ncbi:MAG: hypothetical protein ISS89_05655 [Candidatus Omnitrophica bacterium]|nr:hypothetical protein [Candidatus Omnitrophota bacterium]
MKDKFLTGRAQGVLEYVLLIAVIAAALMAMNVYVQRSMQANLKMVEDQINAQPQ